MAHRDMIVALRYNGVEVSRMTARVEVWRRGDLNRTLEENFGPLVEEIIRAAGEAGEEVGDLAVRLRMEDDGTDPFPVYFHFDPPEAEEETQYRGTYEMDDGEMVEIRTWDGRLISRERSRVVPRTGSFSDEPITRGEVYRSGERIEVGSDDRFYYFGLDPAQSPHGPDGGTPMTLAELLSADTEMDRIDGILDGGLDGPA